MDGMERIAELNDQMEKYMGIIEAANDMETVPPQMKIDFLGDEILRLIQESGASKRERDQYIRELTSKMRDLRAPNVPPRIANHHMT